MLVSQAYSMNRRLTSLIIPINELTIAYSIYIVK